MHNVGHNTLNVCQGPNEGLEVQPTYMIKILCLEIIYRTLGREGLKKVENSTSYILGEVSKGHFPSSILIWFQITLKSILNIEVFSCIGESPLGLLKPPLTNSQI